MTRLDLGRLARRQQPAAWVESALCAQVDPEIFHPPKGGSTKEAKSICNGNPRRGTEPCPVREVCLEDAIARHERFGIYGGKSERERRAILLEREAA